MKFRPAATGAESITFLYAESSREYTTAKSAVIDFKYLIPFDLRLYYALYCAAGEKTDGTARQGNVRGTAGRRTGPGGEAPAGVAARGPALAPAQRPRARTGAAGRRG